MEIVDNSPEMDLSDPKTTEILDNLRDGKPMPEEKEEKGDKQKVEVSPTTTEVEKEEDPLDTKENTLESQVKGLKAELGRRQGNADKVHGLELELARLQEEFKAKAKVTDPLLDAIQGLPDKEVITKQADWEAELSIATAKWERADENGNNEGLKAAADRISHAKYVLSLLRSETIERSDRKHTQRAILEKETTSLTEELGGMYETLQEAHPDFTDMSSELWKAGNEEFLSHPTLMAKLGPAGEVVAAAMAIVRNPQLVKGGAPQASRKDILKNIDKGFGKALQGGTTSPNSSRNTDYSGSVNSAEGLAKFNDLIDKLKGG